MDRLKIILSFDHELSLGGANCYQTNLFQPTYNIIQLANELNVPVTLFTDVLCAIKFREWDKTGFHADYENQLSMAISQSHDVQLHLHPHWIDSEFKDGRFIPSNNFKLSDFQDRESPNNISGIVKQGVDYLNDICKRHDSNYRCIAFRAGGYNLAPETASILSSLYENGIRIESSITKNFYFKSSISLIDFRNMPSKANWFLPVNGPLNHEAESGLFEVPIAGKPRGTLNNLPFLAKRVLYKKRAFQSGGWGIHSGHTSAVNKLSRLFPASSWMLGFDNYAESVSDLMKIIKYHIRTHSSDNEIICSAISHPKSMGSYNLSLMRDFVQTIQKEMGNNVEFCTYQQVYRDLKLGH